MTTTYILTQDRMIRPPSDATPWQLAGEATLSLRGGLLRIGRWFRAALPDIAEGIGDVVGGWLESIVTWEPKAYREDFGRAAA